MNRPIFSTQKSSKISKMLTLLACLAIAPALMAGQLLPLQEVPQYGFQPQQLEALHMMDIATPGWLLGTKQGFDLKPVPDPGHDDFPLNCDNWDSNYCNYYYPGSGCCCVAQVLIPGSLCGPICV